MSSTATATTSALKERAGVVAALADGTQTVLVRSPDRQPDPGTGAFFLYPAYAHQRSERYDDSHRSFYEETREKPAEGIPIVACAEVAGTYRVPAADLDRLAERYVYTADGLREKYGIEDEARILVLRVARLVDPVTVEERAAYRGCRRWIDLEDDRLKKVTTTPVLDDAAFEKRRTDLEKALEG